MNKIPKAEPANHGIRNMDHLYDQPSFTINIIIMFTKDSVLNWRIYLVILNTLSVFKWTSLKINLDTCSSRSSFTYICDCICGVSQKFYQFTLSHIQQISSRRLGTRCSQKMNIECKWTFKNRIELKTLSQKEKLLVLSNFSFCHIVFQESCLLMCHKSSKYGNGLKRFLLWQPNISV